jgi:hypothetical protein
MASRFTGKDLFAFSVFEQIGAMKRRILLGLNPIVILWGRFVRGLDVQIDFDRCDSAGKLLFGARPTAKQDWAYCVLLSLDLAQSWERNSPISRRMIW